MFFRLQEGYSGGTWKTIKESSELITLCANSTNMQLDKYEYRVLHLDGTVIKHWKAPYENVVIDLINDDNPLQDIFDDYAIDFDTAHRLIQIFLANNMKDK